MKFTNEEDPSQLPVIWVQVLRKEPLARQIGPCVQVGGEIFSIRAMWPGEDWTPAEKKGLERFCSKSFLQLTWHTELFEDERERPVIWRSSLRKYYAGEPTPFDLGLIVPDWAHLRSVSASTTVTKVY
jgi:hypothetical protein